MLRIREPRGSLFIILDIYNKIYILYHDISLWNTRFYLLMFFNMNELNHLLIDFIDFERNVKNRSLSYQRYYYHVKRLNQYLLWKWILIPEEVSLSELLNFLNFYKISRITSWPNAGKYPSRNSLYNMIVSIRMFFKYLTIIWRKLQFNWEQIPIIKMDDIRREPMQKEDYEILRQAPLIYNDREDIILRDQLLFEIPRETWLRRAELSRLKFEYFHNANRQFQIEVKWGRYESVFFSEWLRRRVLKYENLVKEKYRYHNPEYLFFYMWQKEIWKQMSPKVIWIIVWEYVKKLKIDGKVDKKKKLCLHMERHSFAMKCVYSGLSQQATTALMRHKDPKITLHYYHMNNEWLLNQYDKIN